MINMAKIREKSQVLMFILLLFFLASMTVGGLVGGANIMDRLFGKNEARYYVGIVDGEEITHREFLDEQNQQLTQQRQSGATIDSRAVNNARNTAWNTLVDRILQTRKIMELELQASDDEIYEFLLLTPPTSLQSQLTQAGFFADSSGNFLREEYQTALRLGEYPPQLDQFWMVWEDYLRDWLPNRKMQNIYNQTGSLSEFDVKREYIKKNIRCSLEYLLVNSSNIPDSLIIVSDEDLQARYDEQKEESYKTQPSKTVDYVFWSTDLTEIDSTLHSSFIDSVTSAALLFASEADFSGFVAAADTFGMTMEDTLDISEGYEGNSGIPFQMGVLRNAVRFAWDNPIGSISDPLNTDNGIAVFRILGDKPGGYRPFEDVKENIQRTIVRERKKDYARELLSELAFDSADWAPLAEASEYIDYDSDSLKILGGSFKKIGRSNELTGTLRAMNVGDTAGPVETFSSVVYLRMLEKDEFDPEKYAEEREAIREQLLATRQNSVYTNWLSETKKNLDIQDFRSKVY